MYIEPHQRTEESVTIEEEEEEEEKEPSQCFSNANWLYLHCSLTKRYGLNITKIEADVIAVPMSLLLRK